MRNPGIAAVLSFFFTGLGQLYNGEIHKAFLLMGIQIINLSLTLILIGWIPLFIMWVWAIFDAHSSAERLNRR